MKFGLRLHSLRVPEWCGFYIDYTGLRQKIRILAHSEGELQLTGLSTRLQTFRSAISLAFGSEVYGIFSENIKLLQNFRQKKDLPLFQLEADLCDLKVLLGVPVIDRKHFKIEPILQSCQQVIEELKLLEWFDRVNEAAADKLYTKLAKNGQSATETHLINLSR
jgi:hypothetical protein